MQKFIGQIIIDPKGYYWEWPNEAAPASGNPRLCYRSRERWSEQIRRVSKEAWDVAGFSDARIYDPFTEQPTLFLKMARIGFPEKNAQDDPWFDKIVAFANQYGSVGHPYDALKRSDEEFSTVLDWRLTLEILLMTIAKARLIPDPGSNSDQEQTASQRHTRQAAAEMVLLDGIPVWVKMVGGRAGNRQFGLAVYDLWDVVRLQLSMALVGDSRFRECPTCGQPFEISRNRGRSDKQFCSQNCRVKCYQRKKARARQLFKEGRPLKQIADEVESDVKTVKGWVSK